MAVWLAVKIRRGLTAPQNHRAYEIDPKCSFGDLSQRLSDLREDERIAKIEIRSSTSSFTMEVRLETPIAICTQFSAFMVEFIVEIPEVIPESEQLTVLGL